MNFISDQQHNKERTRDLPIIVLVGPTAIGKTELSLQLAEEFGAEIIGVDSMQIYKFMDVGTAKPTIQERERVPHHLIDFIDPACDYNVSSFTSDAQEALCKIYNNKHIPVMAGGTGLYFRGFFDGIFNMPVADPGTRQQLLKEYEEYGAVVLYKELQGCDPESAARIHKNDTARLLRALEIFRSSGTTWSKLIAQHKAARQKDKLTNIPPLKIGLQRDRQQLYKRINQRVEIMIEQGLLNEVEKLLSMGYRSTLHSMQSLGYRHMLNFLADTWTWDKTLELLARDTRRYAKRQLTWFSKDSEIAWFSPDDYTRISGMVEKYLNSNKQQTRHYT